jgi:hypothetical protein
MLSRMDRIRLYKAMSYIDSVAIMLRSERQKINLKIDIGRDGEPVIGVSIGNTRLELSKGQALVLALRLVEGVLEADRVEWMGV